MIFLSSKFGAVPKGGRKAIISNKTQPKDLEKKCFLQAEPAKAKEGARYPTCTSTAGLCTPEPQRNVAGITLIF